MVELARKAVPYTPVDRPLKELTVALASSAAVHRKVDDPFNIEGDERFYIFPGDLAAADLMVTHSHYDHTDADRDINCVFPIDRLRELAGESCLKAVSNKRVGFMGFTKKLGEMGPAIAQEIEHFQADAVVLTAG